MDAEPHAVEETVTVRELGPVRDRDGDGEIDRDRAEEGLLLTLIVGQELTVGEAESELLFRAVSDDVAETVMVAVGETVAEVEIDTTAVTDGSNRDGDAELVAERESRGVADALTDPEDDLMDDSEASDEGDESELLLRAGEFDDE
jgi:hypothetical protein